MRAAQLAGELQSFKKWYLRMSNFDLTFYKVYLYGKGLPGINLKAGHESCTHPNIEEANQICQQLS